VNAAGELFVVDRANFRVRKVGINGLISTFAGTGVDGFSGDGGQAANAKCAGMMGVAVDANGTVLVGDIGSRRVRQITAGGAGTWKLTGTPLPAHVGVTNVSLALFNGTVAVTQSYTLVVSGMARPLVLRGALAVSNNVAASATFGTDFGTVGSNTVQTLTLSITNSGSGPMTISGVSTSGLQPEVFSLQSLPSAVAAGTASNFSIAYSPMSYGAHTASFSITNNGTNTPYVINVAGTGVKPGEIGLNRASFNFSATYGGVNPATQAYVITNKGGVGFAYSNIFDAAWFNVNAPTGYLAAGAIKAHTGTVSVAGLNAGVYVTTNTVSSATASNSPVDMLVQLTLAQAGQTITFPAIGDQKITNSAGLRATATSSQTVTFAVASGPGSIDGTNLTFNNDGTVWVVASQTGDVNYFAAASVTQAVNVAKATATVTVTSTNFTYDGNLKQALYQTSPTGLTCLLTYNGFSAPSGAGTYAVNAQVSDATYGGTGTGTLTIAKASQTITSFIVTTNQLVAATVELSAQASSGLGVTNFVVVSGPGAITGGINLSFTAVGTVLVAATQAGDNNWNAAPNVTNTLIVASDPVWTSIPVTTATDGNLYTYTLGATDPGGLPITFSNLTLPPWLTLGQAGGSPIISTIAGNGISGYSGDNGPATNAIFSNLYGIAADADGNVYVPDYFNNRIRKISTAGIITTIAGTGTSGWSGDGGAATNAKISNPIKLCVSASGVVYFTDYGNNRIRRIGTNGIITTVAGNGSSGYSGDGGQATSATLSTPYGVAVDAAGNLYIADFSNYRIRRVGTDGIIRTFAGTGSVSYNGDGIAATSATLRPIDVAVDAYGNVLVSDYANNRIRKINASGTISTIGGNGVAGYSGDGGVATNAQIKNPYGVTIDTSGNLYLADYGNYRVRRIDTNGMISTYAGNGSNGYSGDGGAATNAVVSVSSVAVDGAGTLVISGFDYRIRRVSSAASSWKLSGTPLIPPATVGQTNVTLYADNGSRSTPQSFTITIAGRARPLLLGEDGVALQNNAPASTAGGTDFGTVPTNANASVTLTITNFGSAELQLTGFTKSGAGAAYFLMSELPSPIAVGGVGEITISYLPSALGLQIASFSIINNGTNTPYVINVAGSGVKPGEMRLQGTFLDYIATYGGTNPAVKTFALQNVGAVAYNYTNTISYGAGGSGWLAVTPNTGAIGPVASPTFAPLIYVAAGNMTGTVNIAGLNAGEYWATNTVSSTNAINSPMNVLARITIGKATQSITNFQAIAAGQTVTSTVVLVAQASSSLAVTFAVASGPGSITNGTGLSFTGNGSVYVVASQTGGVNYLAAPGVTQRVDVIKMTAALVLTNLSYTYDGNAKQATCQTSPTGLTCIVTYDLGAAPSNAGSYAVEATISDANYQGIATGTLVIAKATQTVTFPPIGIQNMTNLVALGATASSGLTASYAIVSGPGVLSGSTLSFNGAGTVLVAAAQAGNGNWNAAAAQTNSVQVYSVPVWTSTPITNAVEGMLYTCTPAATDPANLPVTISGTVLPGWLTLTNVAGSGSGFGISTFAGNGTWGYSGDGGQATDAKLAGPAGVVMDSAGNQYISEVGNQLIRKVRADGVIEVFAGNGTRGSSGDGGQAADAQLADPYGLALDTAGNLYVADYNNNRIRRIGTDGIITTVAGTGTSGFSGDGGQATSAQLYGPVGVTVDSSGAIYVADYNNCRIRKIGADGIIRTIAGTVTAGYNGDGIAATNAQLNHPFRMAVDAQGVVYVADYANNRVRRIGTDGIIQTVAGTGTAGFSGDGGAATNAQLSCPIAVSLDSGGALYVADIGNNRIRRVGTNGLIEAVAGTSGSGSTGDGGPATNATFQNIFDVAVAGNSIYVADYAGCKVRKLAPQSAIWSLAGTPLPVNIGPNPVTLTAGNGISNAVQSFNIVVAGLARPLVKNQDGAVISNGVTADYMLGTDFGTVATNEDLTVTLSITNSGTAALQISGVTITGGAAGYFTVSNMPATVGVGAVSNFSILYAPAALGPHSAAIALANNGTNTPYVVNLAGTGVKPGSIWLNRGQLVYAATYGGADPSAATFVITNKGAAPFGYSNTVSYDESASGWLSVAAATGQLAVAGLQTHTGTVSIAGLDVGVYYAVNTITSPTAENSGVEMTAMLTIAQATQAIVFAAIPDQPITNTVALSATATSSNLVSFSVASGPGAIAEDGTSLTFSADGTVYIVASQAGSLNYLAADSVTQRVNVLKMNAGITLSNLSYVYNGTVRNATVTTVPSGLAVQVTYNNSGQAPSNAGSYAVSATIQEHNYSGQATGTMTIAMSDQSITFANPGAQLTTNHLGLTVIASSGLSVTCAVVSGSAAISGYTNLTFTGTGLVSVLASQPGDGNWNAAPSVPQTFDVTKAVAGVTLNGLAQTYTGTPCVVTATTVPGGLTLNITYDGSASAPTAAGSYAVTGTVNEVMYQGSATGTLVVAPRSLAVVLIAPISKVYDGNATATLADTNYFFTGLAGSEKPVMTKLIGAYATTNAGAGIVVGTALIASDFTEADGFLKANYSLPTGATGSVGVITKTPLTATLVPAISKVYDGNATATLGATNYALSGFIGSETSAVNQTAGTYAITNAGTGISVSATLAAANFPGSVGGFNTNNYTLPTIASGSVGVITKAPLTATLVPTISKVYDGNAAATLGATNYALSGLIGSETSAVNQTAGTYATTNAGTGISVSATLAAANFPGSVGGFNTNNYTLPTTASGSVGVITKAPLTAALVPTISKVYDGNATATLGATNYALSGLIGSETSAVNQAAGTYATTNAGTGISVSATLAAANFPGSVGGFNTNNYTLPTIASGSVGVITKAPLTATLVPTISKVYDGNAAATLGATNYALSGLIGSETSAVNQTAGTYAI
ncbi:MAG: MBG domain-containing protein, partial [bacterium]